MSEKKNPNMGGTTLGNAQGVETTDNPSTVLDSTETEKAVLRGLIGAPAGKVHGLFAGPERLEELDFNHAPAWTICQALKIASSELILTHTPKAPVDAALVKDYLLTAGELANHNTHAVLLTVSTGEPVPWPLVEEHAHSLKMYRLRRALATAGHSLERASTGTTDAIRITLKHLDFLQELARRAGLNPTGEQGNTPLAPLKARAHEAARCTPLADGKKDPNFPTAHEVFQPLHGGEAA